MRLYWNQLFLRKKPILDYNHYIQTCKFVSNFILSSKINNLTDISKNLCNLRHVINVQPTHAAYIAIPCNNSDWKIVLSINNTSSKKHTQEIIVPLPAGSIAWIHHVLYCSLQIQIETFNMSMQEIQELSTWIQVIKIINEKENEGEWIEEWESNN